MSRWFALSLLVPLLASVTARADLRQYIDDQTLLAAEADLTRVNPAQLEPFLRDLFKQSGITGGKNPVMSDADQAQFIGQMNAWLSEVSKAGGKQIYVVTHLGLIKDNGIAVIIPAAPGGDAKKLASLLFSGKVNGPTSHPAATGNFRGAERWVPHADVLNGNVAVWGTTNAITYARMLKPAPRPDMEAALKAAGDAPIKVVAGAPMMVRALMGGGMPQTIFDQPSTAVSQDLQWLAAAATLPPSPSIKIIAQASNADAAKKLHHIATYGLAAMSGVPPQISPDMAKLLTPTLSNDQLIVTADQAKLIAFAKELIPPLRMAREQAQRVASMSNMRQIIMGCLMYSSENKGKWPDDLKATAKYIQNAQVMKNPRHPELDPAYIYIKPKNTRENTSQRMILYESHKDFGNGVNVGFADGHVEYVMNKQRFDELLAQTEMDAPAR